MTAPTMKGATIDAVPLKPPGPWLRMVRATPNYPQTTSVPRAAWLTLAQQVAHQQMVGQAPSPKRRDGVVGDRRT